MKASSLRRGIAVTEHPRSLGPGIGVGGRHGFGEIHAGQSRKAMQGCARVGLHGLIQGGITGNDDSRLRPRISQNPGQLSGINVGNSDHI